MYQVSEDDRREILKYPEASVTDPVEYSLMYISTSSIPSPVASYT